MRHRTSVVGGRATRRRKSEGTSLERLSPARRRQHTDASTAGRCHAAATHQWGDPHNDSENPITERHAFTAWSPSEKLVRESIPSPAERAAERAPPNYGEFH